jgi:hypothetical protein
MVDTGGEVRAVRNMRVDRLATRARLTPVDLGVPGCRVGEEVHIVLPVFGVAEVEDAYD